MMRITLGYPDQEAELALLAGGNPRARLYNIKPVVSIERFIEIQSAVDSIHCAEPLLHYVQHLIQSTRNPGLFPVLFPVDSLASVSTRPSRSGAIELVGSTLGGLATTN